MKSLQEYLIEAEDYITNPAVGDAFEINCKEDTLIESVVLETRDDGVVVAADQQMLDILESYGYELEDEPSEGVSVDYSLPMEDGTGGQMFGNFLEEEHEGYPMERALLHRIMMDNTSLLAKYGPEAVMNAVRDESEWVGDVDEIGSSDVSASLKRVIDSLEASSPEREVDEAKYRGREVPLNKPMKGDVKKSKVYVKDPKTGNIKKVNFGDPNMRIKKSNPKRRKSFRARHNCANPGPKTKARYWSCRAW